MTIGTGAVLMAIGAGIAVGCSAIGSGIGVGIVGSAAAGVISERSDKFGMALVFTAIPQTQAIYGLLIAVLMLALTGILSSDFSVEMPVAIGLIGAGLAVGLAGFSAIGQGITCSSGIAATARNPSAIGRSLVFAAMSETFAIFGLLIAILILFGLGLFSG